ncbi:aminotransferase class III-fold pyridoxal phosphate-dependent enzyme [Streptomyces hesseae]|uniref:Diaminobutyrate--2-oxoglutarate transaminase n=1 Tax=Streptomyces hesseae TaxID=3075519 RepID=A0ABU2SPL0_9ACTN|nr:aminotransferase class III-fold pyridoxal phosphate-dependent enzyme [Streptomyces sp. DSM 40473]MDT0450259.1 aminotransferase class III-fold pyridoxal phosphate-dependent enzyme [Streptomyces sp. DSM 40473]
MAPTRPTPPAPPLTRRPGRAGTLRRQPARESSARTYARSLPVVPVRARGLTIEGADGRRYLDCLSGGGALALGHNHPVVLEAIRAVLDSGAPLQVPDLATPVQEAFADELFATLPRGLADSARIRFCGPAATDALADAFRLVRAATGRDGLLALADGGPGEAVPDVLDVRGPRVARLTFPQGHASPAGDAGETSCPISDVRRDIPLPAGLVVEPVLGDGVVPLPDDRLRRLRDITAARAVPLIADEAWTGAGRTGAFWAVEHSGVVPDVMVLSRAIGGSLPLAVIVHHDDLGARPRHRDEAVAFQGNQLAMAAGTATLRHIRENGLERRAAVLGARMLEGLRRLAREHECVADVRGKGLMIGIEVTDPEAGSASVPGAGSVSGAGVPAPGRSASSAVALAEDVQRECLRRGLIVGLSDRRPPVIRLLPPLTLTDEQAEAVLDRLSDAVAAASRTVRRHPTS